ncbi:hypothetical protein [Paenibacillus medicaginis]|uniref:Transposase n=1 Tax=Paenibacillus medicaginis TaxID=1470560 RepID=A0ABV5C5T1_9BACL
MTARAEAEGSFPKITTKHIEARLPAAVLNQAIRDARSVYRKTVKKKKRPVLQNLVYCINNQNYSIGESAIAFPIYIGNKVKKTAFPAIITDREHQLLQQAKPGLMRIVEKSGKWYAQISLELSTPSTTDGNIMGVDVGLKVPAVAVTEEGRTCFFGNGRENKYRRRRFHSIFQELVQKNQWQTLSKWKDKEQRWMQDQDHKISR